MFYEVENELKKRIHTMHSARECGLNECKHTVYKGTAHSTFYFFISYLICCFLHHNFTFPLHF